MKDDLRKMTAALRGVLGLGHLQATIGAASVEQQRLLYRAQYAGDAVKPLAYFSESSFSQNGEDGVISEIFRRLGRAPESFVEIGAGNGVENNTILLLLGGARGLWVEADGSCAAGIRSHHGKALSDGRLTLSERRVTAENVNEIVAAANGPRELDLLSIDIDGNDYWIWKALDAVAPRVVVMEYNAGYGSSLSWVKAYDPGFAWSGRDRYYGASLTALERLGREKGYALIGADFLGVNAFFLRGDLVSDAFAGPFTAREVFQPFRRGLGGLLKAQAPAFGPYENP